MKINETRNSLRLMGDKDEVLAPMSVTKETFLQEILDAVSRVHPGHPLVNGIKLRSGSEDSSLSFPWHIQSNNGRINGALPFSDEETFLLEIAGTWLSCTHHGSILSSVDRINDIPRYLAELGVDYLIPYLPITEKTGAFVFNAELSTKSIIRVVEVYEGMRGTEWRVPRAQLALRLDDDLAAGLIDDVAVVNFVVPFAETARIEAGRGRFELPRADD